jgi:hypothetical protein
MYSAQRAPRFHQVNIPQYAVVVVVVVVVVVHHRISTFRRALSIPHQDQLSTIPANIPQHPQHFTAHQHSIALNII